MKIGVFGGSFNPIHNMHLDIANQLIQKGFLDKIIFVPTSTKYPKENLIANEERLQMLQLIQSETILVSDFEFQDQLVYTYQTLDHFKQCYPTSEIYLVIGQDNLDYLQQWRNYQHILDNYPLLVIRRMGNYTCKVKPRKLIFPDITPNSISSSYIRDLLAKRNPDAAEYLPSKVYQYILQHHLYEKENAND